MISSSSSSCPSTSSHRTTTSSLLLPLLRPPLPSSSSSIRLRCALPSVIFLSLIFIFLLIPGGRGSEEAISEHFPATFGSPRFKQNARNHQFAYLGDTIRLKCNAIGRPQPRVHWYREGRYLNYSYMVQHPRLKERGMSLELKRIEVGDRGNWTCRVWNSEGSVTRNFTLHIVDFCDYFLNVHIHPRRVPEECLCQWAVQQRESLQAPDLLHLRALPQLRADLDLSEFTANNGSRCVRYAKVEEIARLRTQPREEGEGRAGSVSTPSSTTTTTSTTTKLSTTPATPATPSAIPAKSAVKWTMRNPVRLFDHLVDQGVPDVSHLLPELIPPAAMDFLRRELARQWNDNITQSLDLSAKIQLAGKIMREMKQKGRRDGEDEEEEKGEDEEEDEDEKEEDKEAAKNRVEWWQKVRTSSTTPSTTTTTSTTTPKTPSTTRPWTTRATRPPSWLTTKRWALSQRVPPYFRQLEEQTLTHIVIPAGRTLKLSCKAGGQPEPQVVWRKDNEEILRDTESRTGSLFQLRRWTLELEDATEIDSGEYACEVFNSGGTIVRRFRVEVQDRIRSRPILVPNVLVNKTVDVNGTVDFSCQVISDLVPHIVWIKLVRKDGSFIRWDPKQRQYTFNFMDMNTQKRARIYHDKQNNKYTMELVNVTMDDQGIYSCVAGNTLGMSMANATLTVNEFRPLTLPTDVSHSWPLSYTVLLILSFLLLCAFIALGMLYLFFSKKFSAKNRIQTLDSMSVRKKVVITKKPQREGEFWSDLASSYSITVEPVPVRGRERRGSRIGREAGGGSTGDMVPLMGEGVGGQGAMAGPGGGAGGEMSMLSEYEVPTDTAWEVERERLQLVDILGEGAFGEVWRGVLKPKNGEEGMEPMPVAVKRLKTAAQERELIILVSEMQILKSIGHHPNILRLVGCCTGLGPLLVVLELCVHGNLKDFLRKHRPREGEREESEEGYAEEAESTAEAEGAEKESEQSGSKRTYQNVDSPSATAQGPGTSAGATMTAPPESDRQLTLRDLVRFAVEIARGMEFLASKKIIHRDLAARNVLVGENLVMKISDFGLSRHVFYHDYYRKRGAGRLPIKWMAPEALEANVYTVHSDVWSYGILLWEIMTLGGTPYPSIAMPQLYNLLKEGYRMEAPHNCPEEIYEVMVNCWQEKPEARPAFRTIAEYFGWMLQESENYISRSSDGETTDEGPYAVITEGQSNGQRAGAGTGTAGGQPGGQQRAGGAGRRPVSAPGMMSFERFSREMGVREVCAGNVAPPTAPAKLPQAPSTPAPKPPPRPERRSLMGQLQRVVWKGRAEKPLVETEAEEGSGVEEAEGGDGEGRRTPTRNIYKNFQCQPSNVYANTSPASCAATGHHHHPPGPSSSLVEGIAPSPLPGCSTSSSQPPQPRPKKSVVSEHGLRLQGALFAGIAQQNAKMGGGTKDQYGCGGGSSKGTAMGSGSSASFGRSPLGSSVPLGARMAGDRRSRSVDSSSSGHGGSSAMSSAEGLLAGGTAPERKEEEGGRRQRKEAEEAEDGGQRAVDYVSIAPIGQFPIT